MLTLRLQTERLLITAARPDDVVELAVLHHDNADHFAQWDPPRPPGWSTLAFWASTIERSMRDEAAGVGVRLVLRSLDDDALVGNISLQPIERGPFQNARLGYKLDPAFEGRGLMREALSSLLDAAFGPLGLHRVEANHLPENARSATLLDALGFERHGVAAAYLQIGPDGRFRDHVLRSTRAERWLARGGERS